MSLVTVTLKKGGDKVFFTWNDSTSEGGSVWIQLQFGEPKKGMGFYMTVKFTNPTWDDQSEVELLGGEVHCWERDVGRAVWASLRRNGWEERTP